MFWKSMETYVREFICQDETSKTDTYIWQQPRIKGPKFIQTYRIKVKNKYTTIISLNCALRTCMQ